MRWHIEMKKILFLLILLLLTSCKKEEAADVPVKDLLSSMKTEVDFENAKTEDITSIETAQRYGISTDDVKEGYVYYTADETKPDKIIIIKAKDTDAVEDIQHSLNSEIIGLKNTWKADNTESKKIENHLFKTKDKYIILSVAEDNSKIENIFDSKLETK